VLFALLAPAFLPMRPIVQVQACGCRHHPERSAPACRCVHRPRQHPGAPMHEAGARPSWEKFVEHATHVTHVLNTTTGILLGLLPNPSIRRNHFQLNMSMDGFS
jgi:hypothetical protein